MKMSTKYITYSSYKNNFENLKVLSIIGTRVIIFMIANQNSFSVCLLFKINFLAEILFPIIIFYYHLVLGQTFTEFLEKTLSTKEIAKYDFTFQKFH